MPVLTGRHFLGGAASSQVMDMLLAWEHILQRTVFLQESKIKVVLPHPPLLLSPASIQHLLHASSE